MKWMRKRRPSPALVISVIALGVALAETAGALPGRNSVKSNDIAHGAVRAGDLGAVVVRSAAIRDLDPAAGDGTWTSSTNSAFCHRGERVLSGGVRTGSFPVPPQAGIAQSEPRESKRQWVATITTDTGGSAQFGVVAMCLRK
jgi:hypothetical protein